MDKTLVLTVLLLLITVCNTASLSDCQQQNYIIPYQALDTVFDGGIDAVRNQQTLITLIENPNTQTIQDYILSLMPFSAPLFVMAGITFAIFIATIVQVICFNTCGKECCGNQLDSSTYNICCMRTMTISFILLSFFTLALCIAALIVNSDLQKAIDFTSCNTLNIINETYDGNSNQSMPWSGIQSFDSDIEVFSINIQNTVPALVYYFSTNNSGYNAVINNTANSAFDLAANFSNCPTAAVNLSPPFTNPNPNSTYTPVFYADFCDQGITGSAQNLINAEIQDNTITWRTQIQALSASLANVKTEQSTLNKLVAEVTNFTQSLTTFEQNLDNGFSDAQNINYNLEIAFYVFYSFLLLCSLVSITTVCCTYYCNNFTCKCWTYVFWYAFFFYALILFILAGLFLAGSILTFDTCTAYPYYFNSTNGDNLKKLNFNDPQVGDIFQTCFYTNATSIFKAFNDTDVLNQFQTIRTQYAAAVPPTSFTSVVTSIQNNLYGYGLNPATVVIEGNIPKNQQPSGALAQFNLFTNSSNPSSTQTCGITNFKAVFDPIDCSPELFLSDECFILTDAYNFTTRCQNITNQFLSKSGCTNQSEYWNSTAYALYQYGQSTMNLVLSLAPFTQQNPQVPLQQYQTNYFNYYTLVNNYLNLQTQGLFNSFFDAYDSLNNGSSCTYVVYSMNGIVDIACNQLFPYFNALSVLNIIISVLVFIMMILSYFLTTRYQFYEFLQGNFQNFGVETFKVNQLPGYTIDSSRDKNIQLIEGGTIN